MNTNATDALTKDLEPSTRRFALRPRNFSVSIPGTSQTNAYLASLKRKCSEIESENVNEKKKLKTRTKSEGGKPCVSSRKRKKMNEDKENAEPPKAMQKNDAINKKVVF